MCLPYEAASLVFSTERSDERSLVFRDCLYCSPRVGELSVGLRGYLNLLYSQAVFNLYAFVFCLFCSRSLLTFHRVKSNKSARHRQNKAQQPFARAVLATLGRLLFAAQTFSFLFRRSGTCAV